MNKTEFIAKFAELLGTTKKETKEVVDLFIKTAKEVVIDEGSLDLSGFIKIEKVHKESRECINPQTKEMMSTKPKDVPKVRFSAKFKREIENGVIEE